MVSYGIHLEMDCRIKYGNDGSEITATPLKYTIPSILNDVMTRGVSEGRRWDGHPPCAFFVYEICTMSEGGGVKCAMKNIAASFGLWRGVRGRGAGVKWRQGYVISNLEN